MTDAFHSADITPNGISVKVGTHRRAIGVGDYASKAAFTTAVAALLTDVLGANLALVAANVAAAETDASARIAALVAAHAAEKAALEADLAILGTKPEAAQMRKDKAIAAAQAKKDAAEAELAALTKADVVVDADPVDVLP